MSKVEKPNATQYCVHGTADVSSGLVVSVFDPTIRDNGVLDFVPVDFDTLPKTAESLYEFAANQRKIHRRIVLIGDRKYSRYPSEKDAEDPALSFDLVLSLPQKKGLSNGAQGCTLM